MKDLSRRQLLTVGILGRTVTLAGCLGRPIAEHAPTALDDDSVVTPRSAVGQLPTEGTRDDTDADEHTTEAQFSLWVGGGSVELRHDVGDSIAAADVVVTVDGTRAADQFEGHVSAGASLALDATSGATIEVTHVDGVGSHENSTTLAVLTVP